MPRLLGVSKAILDNVIFCHQEESNWPLSEASVLKKKFDDIFDATRYTKALDSIKSLRKERVADVKVNKAELEALQTDRDRSEVLRDKKSRLAASLAEKKVTYEQVQQEVVQLSHDNKIFYDRAAKFRDKVGQYENLQDRIKIRQENRSNLKKDMKETSEPDDELQRRKDKFQDHLDDLRRRKGDLSRRIASKRQEIQTLNEAHSNKLSEKGALENDKSHHERSIARREREIRQMSKDLSIPGFDVDGLSSHQINDFSQRVTDASTSSEEALQSWKRSSAATETDLTNKYQELRSDKSNKVSMRDNTATRRKQLKDQIKKSQDQLDGIAVAEADLIAARDALAVDQNRLSKLRKEIEDSNFDEQIRKKNNEIRELDDRREDATGQLNALNRHADYRAKLDIKKKDAEAKEKALQALLDRHSSAFKNLTGQALTVDNFDRELSRVLSAKDREVSSAERDEQEKLRAVQHLESTVSLVREQCKTKKGQLEQLQGEIRRFLETAYDAQDVAKAIEQAQYELEDLEKDHSDLATTRGFFERLFNTAEKDSNCVGCNRHIADDELSAVKSYMANQLKRLTPEALAEAAEAIKGWKEQLANAQAMLPKEQTVRDLKSTEIPALESQIAQQSKELHEKGDVAEKANQALKTLKEEQQEIVSLKRAASEAARLAGEVATMKKEANEMQKDLESTGSTQTGDQVQAIINDLSESIKSLKRELATIERAREAKRVELSNAERAQMRSERDMAEKEQQDRERKNVQRHLDSLKADFTSHSDQLEKLDEAIDGYEAPIKKAKDELEQARSRHAEEEARLLTQQDDRRSKLRALQEIEQQIQRYIQSRGPQKLADCVAKIADLQGQRRIVEAEVNELLGDVGKIDKDLNESNATERNISDNLRYRALGKELEQLRQDLDAIDLDAAMNARREFDEKYHGKKQKENELSGRASHLAGEIESLESQIKARDEELKTDYKDIHVRFSRKLVEVKTSEIANNDLEKYAKALDAAIIRFHGLKMAEVNSQIRFLWQKTYQGTDIDSISIESDGEKVGGRSYNYRVCMMKDSVQMDMRGRCSAGQKVLASIIIRLALADSFATNCRFMALDEPTLCLDAETVQALAKALGDLIAERKNMQLIIVTHDPGFVDMLSASCSGLDFYWRVSRDTKGKSIVERERVR